MKTENVPKNQNTKQRWGSESLENTKPLFYHHKSLACIQNHTPHHTTPNPHLAKHPFTLFHISIQTTAKKLRYISQNKAEGGAA